MDKYKELYKKGSHAFIETLENIGWFENPYIDKNAIIKDIESCSYPPCFVTCLSQIMLYPEWVDKSLFEDFMKSIRKFIPDFEYEVNTDDVYYHISIQIRSEKYSTSYNIENFDISDFDSIFLNDFINSSLGKSSINYRIYELPPADESTSYIYVTPEIYQKALEIGIIPDEAGYFIINNL